MNISDPDEGIDTSDIPEVGEEWFKKARLVMPGDKDDGYVVWAMPPEQAPRVWGVYRTHEDAENARKLIPPVNSEGENLSWSTASYADYKIARNAFYLATPTKEITAEEWDYALGVLPPLCWEDTSGGSRFLMSEFMHGPFTNQYLECRGRYWTKLVDASDRSTWLTPKSVGME